MSLTDQLSLKKFHPSYHSRYKTTEYHHLKQAKLLLLSGFFFEFVQYFFPSALLSQGSSAIRRNVVCFKRRFRSYCVKYFSIRILWSYILLETLHQYSWADLSSFTRIKSILTVSGDVISLKSSASGALVFVYKLHKVSWAIHECMFFYSSLLAAYLRSFIAQRVCFGPTWKGKGSRLCNLVEQPSSVQNKSILPKEKDVQLRLKIVNFLLINVDSTSSTGDTSSQNTIDRSDYRHSP